MKVVNWTRNEFYRVLANAFSSIGVQPRLAELGVLRGENAMVMYQTMQPSHMTLVDSWLALPPLPQLGAYSPFDKLPNWVSDPDVFADYFGGSMREQATFDALYEVCRERFKATPNVRLLRESTELAFETFKDEGALFDCVYVDANHQYEWVLRDLMLYQELVSPDGCIMLNDCAFSNEGMRQNLGVLEAVAHFIKRAPFRPVAMTVGAFADLILVRQGSQLGDLCDQLFVASDTNWVEVPDQLLGAAKVVTGGRRLNVSFI
ncbi:TPA: class I SAM-dependent methyltransferase [Aeromonas veronii]